MNIIRALFGNDDDGIYGDAAWRANYGKRWWAKTWAGVAIVWWLRNPFHNLFWHVLTRDVTRVWVWDHPEIQTVQGWPQPPDRLLLAVYDGGFPQVAYVGRHWEFRAGFSRKEFTNLAAIRWGFSLRYRSRK